MRGGTRPRSRPDGAAELPAGRGLRGMPVRTRASPARGGRQRGSGASLPQPLQIAGGRGALPARKGLLPVLWE